MTKKMTKALERVCLVFDVTAEEIASGTRVQHIAEARHLLFTLLRGSTRMSLKVIGEAFDRDHTTVLHALHATRRRYDTDERFKKIVDTLFPEARRAMPKSSVSASRYERRNESWRASFIRCYLKSA